MSESTLQPELHGIGLERHRRTLLVADVVESVRLMERDEAGFIEAWRSFVEHVRLEMIPALGGTLVKSLGDGLLIQFKSPVAAVETALAMTQWRMGGLLRLRIGINSADVVIDELDVYGSGVNIASRLAALAGPGEVVASSSVRDAIADGLQARVTDLGECHLKHVGHPVRAFRLQVPGSLPQRSLDDPADGMSAAIAVLPFDCTAADHNGIVLGNALSDAVIARLCPVPGLRVISRLSTTALLQAADPIAACGRHLGALFVAAGNFAVSGGRLKGQARIDDVRSGSTIWNDVFDVDVTALFLDQDRGIESMAHGMARAIARVTVQRARKMPLPNLESFALFLGGVTLLHRLGRGDFLRSRELLLALRERHPRAAAPVAMLAKWHMLHALQGWADDARAEGRLSLQVAHEALGKEPDHPLALSMAALMGAHFDDDIEGARALAQQAVEQDPQEPSAWMTMAGVLSYLHEGQASASCARRAIALSPLDPCRFLFELLLGAGQLAEGRLTDALDSIAASMRLNAVHLPTYRLAVIANMLAGRHDEARAAASGLRVLDPTYRVRHFEDRYPGRRHPHAADYVRALREAGVPD
jgi:adenylate cyclase